MAVPLDWSVRISDMEALLMARQNELEQQLKAKAALEATVETGRAQQKAVLLEVLQLRSKHADASLQLAQIRKLLAESGPASTNAAEVCRLEKRRSKLQAQVQVMQQAQQRERQVMHEFSALIEEHVSAEAAPLQDARKALDQAQMRLRDHKHLAKELRALEAETAQLDADPKSLVQQRQMARQKVEDVQAENKALQRMIDDQRAANDSRAQEYQQAAKSEAAKAQVLQNRLGKLQQESQSLTAEEANLEHKLAECRATLLKLSTVS